MNAYEMAKAITDDPAAFRTEMERRANGLNARLADAAAKTMGLTAEQRDAYYDAIKDLPASLPGPRGTMLPVPVHDIGMAGARGAQ